MALSSSSKASQLGTRSAIRGGTWGVGGGRDGALRCGRRVGLAFGDDYGDLQSSRAHAQLVSSFEWSPNVPEATLIPKYGDYGFCMQSAVLYENTSIHAQYVELIPVSPA